MELSDLPALIDDPSPTPHPGVSEAPIDPSLLEEYLSMGFPEDKVRRAHKPFFLFYICKKTKSSATNDTSSWMFLKN